MINYLNNILTTILWIDFLHRYFPSQSNKTIELILNIYIFLYSYFEIQLKKNGINIFNNEIIEPVTIIENENDSEDENDYNIYNKEIWKIINKHQTSEKYKHS